MRIFVLSQGAILDVFHRVILHLEDDESAAYYVADRRNYEIQTGRGPLAVASETLKEWELVERGSQRRTTAAELREWERRLNVESLWPAVVCDRRMIYGPLAKVRQDYRPARSLEELQGIVVEIASALWGAMDRFDPDVVLAFVPVTIGDYLGYLVARARGVPYLHMKSTKIENFVTLSPDIHEGHPHIRRRLEAYRSDPRAADEWLERAEEYIAGAAARNVTYEGTLRKEPPITGSASVGLFLRHLPGALVDEIRARIDGTARDPQRVPQLGSVWARYAGRWRRARSAERVIAGATIRSSEMREAPQDYVFFPLNSEPEIALSLYAPYHLNQIEVVRSVAQSVSLGTYVVVKEHPRSWGLRPPGYYRRLREIPNVRFLSVEEPTLAGIAASRATVVISGFAAFEAALHGAPVTTLGATPFDMLPDSQVRRVHDPADLPDALARAAPNPSEARAALRAYVAAVMRESVPVDLYTALLRKPGRQRAGGSEHEDSARQLRRLAGYFVRRLSEEAPAAAALRASEPLANTGHE